ncbi:MAG: glycoside hydrolase family 3 C-terminal domain-containing protein [Bacteroidota bacterium]
MIQIRSQSAVAIALLVAFSHGRGIIAQTLESRIDTLISSMTIAEKIKQLHHEGGFNTADNTRLQIPGFIMADGPHGVRDGLATSFPVSIGMAATWDPALIERVGAAMGREFLGKGKHQMLGPSMDLDRDPRNGRTPETGGEDPYLCAAITTAVIRGVQSTGCLATAKHYNGNARENGRTTNNVIVSQQLLVGHYGLQFRSAVQEGGVFSVMNAYNLINGEKCAENRNLLTTILRDMWGYPFYVVSDWGSIWSAQRAITAGCDVCMGSDEYQNDLPGLVSSGTVTEATIDTAVRRVLRTKIVAGMFGRFPRGNPEEINSTAHQELCREAGTKSIVLLRNAGNLLPLNADSIQRIAVIGQSAAVMPVDGSGSAYVTPFYTVSPRQGIERIVGAAKVVYVKGCDINSADTSGFNAATTAAASADVVVYVGGLDGSQEGEGFDRAGGSIDLPGKQQDLINRLAAVNRKLVVVLISGGVCGLQRCIANIPALVQGFYPGQEGGNAVADVLFGVYNPGGKLPVTWPVSDAQLPAWNDDFNDDAGCGYRWFDAMQRVPLFAFGHGFSYTTFGYANLQIAPGSAAVGTPVQVSVDVTNTGTRAGDEVVQLYLSNPPSILPMPVKQLRGFKRITLAPAQTTTVTITLTPEELWYFDEGLRRFEVDPGVYTVRVGGSSENLPLSGTFEVLGGTRKPDLRITLVRSIPPFPVPGDSVLFAAMIKNVGAGSSPAGTAHKILFSVNGQPVSVSDDALAAIPPGGAALITANSGVPPGTNRWVAGDVGTYTVSAVVDPDNEIDEGVESNNTAQAEVRVVPTPPVNLALHRPVTVTSVESASLAGENAVDGNLGTRWSSTFSDPQSITVDLGAVYVLERITLRWETAYGRTYYILVSSDGATFTPVFVESSGDGGLDDIVLSVPGRFVRMTGTSRGTQWGYSLYELQVYGALPSGVDHGRTLPSSFALRGNYPNPFNLTTTIGIDVPRGGAVSLRIYDLLGREVAVLLEGPTAPGGYRIVWNASGLASGTYFCRLSAEGFSETKRLLLQK